MAGVQTNPPCRRRTIEFGGAWQFRRARGGQHHICKLEILLVLVRYWRACRILWMAPYLFFIEVGPVEMRTDRAREAARGLGATALKCARILQKRQRLIVAGDGTRGDDARRAVASVRAHHS